jgi:hypothetical protein
MVLFRMHWNSGQVTLFRALPRVLWGELDNAEIGDTWIRLELNGTGRMEKTKALLQGGFRW